MTHSFPLVWSPHERCERSYKTTNYLRVNHHKSSTTKSLDILIIPLSSTQNMLHMLSKKYIQQ